MNRAPLAAAVAAVFAAGTAHAGFVYVDAQAPARTAVPVPASNYFQSQLSAAGVTTENFSASLALTAGGTVHIDYFGNEAVFINRFVWNGQTVATTPGSLIDPWLMRPAGSYAAGAGTLDFAFCTAGGSGTGSGGVAPACISNADADARAPSALNGFSSFISADGNVAWLLFDDGGGGPDDNHDDMIVRLTYQVPEPGTLGLLGLGLLAAGASAKRRARR